MKNTLIERKRNKIIFIIVVIGCFLYLGAKATYTSYESLIDSNANVPISQIKIFINGENVVANSGSLNNNILLDNVEWTSTHTREGKISPGSSGTISLELDATESEVAILYDFQLVDKEVDEDKYLTFTSVTSSDTIVKTSADTYSGILTMDDIEDGKIVNLEINFEFDSTTDIEGIEDDTHNYSDLFDINFHAVQYKGEELVAYNGG